MVALKVLGVIFFVALVSADVCQFQQNNYYSYDDAVACVRSIPFSEEVRRTTLDSLRKSISVFAFTEPAANLPPASAGLTIKPTDLYQGLDDIASRAYTTDIDFQNDVVQLYNQLCDAHSLYFRPKNYANLVFWQPFSIVSTSGGAAISIAPFFAAGIEQAFLQQTGINVTQWAYASVLMINGMPALEAITSYARDYVGLSKDLATRFNVALTRYDPTPDTLTIVPGAFQRRRGLYFHLPLESKYVNYTLILDGQQYDISVPWIVQSMANYTGPVSWFNDYKNPVHASAPSRAAAVPVEPKSQNFARKLLVQKDVSHATARHTIDAQATVGANGFQLIIQYEQLWLWVHPDQQTLVLYLSTFEPDNVTAYINAMETGFAKAQQLGLSRLLMDFTDNGGGDICFGIAFLQFLYQNLNGDKGLSPTDMPQNAFTTLLSQTAASKNINDSIWSALSYQSYPGGVAYQNSDISWMIPGVSRPRGNGFETKSQLIDLSVSACGYPVVPLNKVFTPDQILILTRGFCGSTCALVSGHSHLFHGVKTITLGGLAQQPVQQFFSFPGLQVVDSPDFYSMWAELGQNITYTPNPNPNELSPRLLPTSAGFRYCIREIYTPTSDFTTPLEYTFTPSDFHIFFDSKSVIHAEMAWLEAVNYFPNN